MSEPDERYFDLPFKELFLCGDCNEYHDQNMDYVNPESVENFDEIDIISKQCNDCHNADIDEKINENL